MGTRVVVADNTRARVFSAPDSLRRLVEQEGFIHSEAHLSNQELVSDAAGRSRDLHGTLDPATSAKDHQRHRFAKGLAKHLKAQYEQSHFDRLVLVAPPKFLGMLHKELPKPVDQLVVATVGKNLTGASEEELVRQLTH